MDTIQIITPQFDRAEKLDFEVKPSNEEEFRRIVETAPYDVLYGFGFRRWSTMNNVIADNQKLPVEHNVVLPAIDLTGDGRDTITLPYGRKQSYPLELLSEDEYMLLFPAEWYDVIPDGFKMTGLYGQDEVFVRGESDNDRRFGCLGYGIRRSVESVDERRSELINMGTI
jgi:hypothetical protein